MRDASDSSLRSSIIRKSINVANSNVEDGDHHRPTPAPPSSPPRAKLSVPFPSKGTRGCSSGRARGGGDGGGKSGGVPLLVGVIRGRMREGGGRGGVGDACCCCCWLVVGELMSGGYCRCYWCCRVMLRGGGGSWKIKQ